TAGKAATTKAEGDDPTFRPLPLHCRRFRSRLPAVAFLQSTFPVVAFLNRLSCRRLSCSRLSCRRPLAVAVPAVALPESPFVVVERQGDARRPTSLFG